MVKFSLSSGWYLCPGKPSIAGYSQSRSMPSDPKLLVIFFTDFANAFLFFFDENTSEQVAQPPQPPIEITTFNFGLFFFRLTIFSRVALSLALLMCSSLPFKCAKQKIISDSLSV